MAERVADDATRRPSTPPIRGLSSNMKCEEVERAHGGCGKSDATDAKRLVQQEVENQVECQVRHPREQWQPGHLDAVESSVEKSVGAHERHAEAEEPERRGHRRQPGLVASRLAVPKDETHRRQRQHREQRGERQRYEEYLPYALGQVGAEFVLPPPATWRESVGKSTVPIATANTPCGS